MSEIDSSGRLKLPKTALPPPLKTKEAVLNYIREQVESCLNARIACDVAVPLKGESLVSAQTRLYKVFLIRAGSALGMLGLALRTEQISPELYAQFTNEVRQTLVPTMAGDGRDIKIVTARS